MNELSEAIETNGLTKLVAYCAAGAVVGATIGIAMNYGLEKADEARQNRKSRKLIKKLNKIAEEQKNN